MGFSSAESGVGCFVDGRSGSTPLDGVGILGAKSGVGCFVDGGSGVGISGAESGVVFSVAGESFFLESLFIKARAVRARIPPAPRVNATAAAVSPVLSFFILFFDFFPPTDLLLNLLVICRFHRFSVFTFFEGLRTVDMSVAMSTRRVKTNIRKINEITSEFTALLTDQIATQKVLKNMHLKLSKHAEKMNDFANSKKDPSGYNLYFRNESRKSKKKGKISGGPNFAKKVAERWNSLNDTNKAHWREKVTRSGLVY